MIGLGAVLLALVLLGVRPQTPEQFRSTVETSVQDALSSVGTARLVGRTALQDNTIAPYESAVLADARKSVATAIADVAEAQPPDASSRELRDAALPLLQESARLIGDLDAGDRTAVDGLAAVKGELASVLEAVR
ncbi:hypothetical protein [Lentzea sp. NPDC059081]|uniref:hypothetical protein n=1 Tax=Lentzea sp. NPDC059081 TaxID=3346719 RepID=UPI00368FAB21